ncbi:DUF190 domain-containing protein [Thermodesulfatator atlanticus]|uniref:DUF190 domain-containing protein n=1 Tax=Thermodesulfatator atlanticus TaxID=501497 RepID=UPI0003B4D5BE|nr:DUF190 domain-containing protein [Thermodesulfatator atlanticus]
MAYKLLSIYIDEDEKGQKKPLYQEVLTYLTDNEIKGATVFKGVFGWGPDGVIHSIRFLRASSGLPMKIEVIEEAEVIEKILPGLKKLVHKGLITVTNIEVIR